jgi:putative ABC transport system permease protein
MILRWALRHLIAQKRFSLVFILNLSLGLIGFLTLETFRGSLDQALQENSKGLLSADLSMSARRELTAAEIEKARSIIGIDREESRLYDFFSMMMTDNGSRLVQIRAIDSKYPFYGELTLSSGKKIIGSSSKEIVVEPLVWVYPELLSQLNLKIGDKIRLGEATYRIADTVVKDSTQTFRMASIAPKTYVGFEQIKKSKLIQGGTTLTDTLSFKLQEQDDVESLVKRIASEIPDPSVRIISYREAGEDSARPLAYLADYLGLASLVSLFLALVGSAYLYRSFFTKQMRAIAIYNILGLQFAQIAQMFLVQVFLLGLVSCVLSYGSALVLFPVLKLALRPIFPIEIPLHMNASVALLAFGLSSLGAMVISGFYLIGFRGFRPSALFQEQFSGKLSFSLQARIYLLLPIFLFFGLSVFQAHSWKVGVLFCGIFFGSLVFVLALNYVILRTIGGWFERFGQSLAKGSANRFLWIWRHAGLQLYRKIRQNLSSAIALSLGAVLMTLLPQLKMSIQNSVEAPEGSVLPALFLFDIQDDQLLGLNQTLTQLGFADLKFSPLIRGRLIRVNDQKFERAFDESKLKTREDEVNIRFRNRGFNLTYREHLDKSEKIIEGKIWDGSFQSEAGGMPQISMDQEYAERMKFAIGDILHFDIQGVEVAGKITSFRSVQWGSFQPNFFVVFQPGVLDGAPKSWLVALPTLAQVDIGKVQDRIATDYPNISAVDVRRTVQKILAMVEQMSWSLQLMAVLCFFVGFFVLYVVVSQQVQDSRWDLNLQKILGASFMQSGLQVWIQYGLLGFISSFVGSALSLGVSFVLTKVIFEIPVSWNFAPLFWTVFGATLISFLISFGASWKLVRERPQIVLQS